MIEHQLVQGSAEWKAHRAKFKNASDAPAMLGISKYKTRNELLHEYHTGMAKEHGASTQKRFDDGHRFEALSRPIAEAIIGEELYPVVGTNGIYGASFDGLTLTQKINWENKTLNDEIRAAETIDDLHEMYLVQMEQQHMVADEAEKTLFTGTKFDDQDNLLEKKELWYTPNAERRQRIIDGWAQFDIDLTNYVPVEAIEQPKAAAIMALPSLAIQIKGEVTLSNLPEFKEAAIALIANINTELVTDEDFSNGDAMAKFCKDAEDNIDMTKAAAIAQTSSIDELMRTLDFIKGQLRTKRLELEKAVKSQKEQIRTNAIMKGKSDYAEHLAMAEQEISPIRLQVPAPDFATAISGVKTIKSLHSKIGDALANAKIVVDAAARDIRAKQAWLKENADGYQFLFNDIQTIIHKAMDDLQILAKSRIAEHKAAEAEKETKIKADAEAEAQAKFLVEQAEKDAIADAHLQPAQAVEMPATTLIEHPETGTKYVALADANLIGDTANMINIKPAIQTQYFAGATPTANEIVCILAAALHVDEALAHKWLIEADFTKYKKAA
jgi:predicted phage-related endonuclease